ncbi:MAG: DUF2254 domain-containing protein [Silicimonas sp.]|nr:DUF2254 domain-containing protein [Silicimonas sp.]
MSPKQALLELRRLSRVLWIRVALIAAVSVVAALVAPVVEWALPMLSNWGMTADATLPILNILASSMLAVATFSLGIMVSSHRALAANTTPRIHRLLMEDRSTQSMLATFVGAFVFALASIILFRADYYSEGAAVVVFATTILLVVAIVVSLVRWIHKLSHIGSVDYALERVGETARESLRAHKESPTLGASALASYDDIPGEARPVVAETSGYVLRVDVEALADVAENGGGEVYVTVLPGDRVLKGQDIARLTGGIEAGKVAGHFSIGSARSYAQDPRYALQVLRETATKALSPGINDPGTAVEVVARLEILLHEYFCAEAEDTDEPSGRVFLSRIEPQDLIVPAFRDIARDGAGFVEVLGGIHAALVTMAQHLDAEARAAVEGLLGELDEYAEAGLGTKAELERFRAETGR